MKFLTIVNLTILSIFVHRFLLAYPNDFSHPISGWGGGALVDGRYRSV